MVVRNPRGERKRVIPLKKGNKEGKMILKECKRLTEVDFPIAAVSMRSVWTSMTGWGGI